MALDPVALAQDLIRCASVTPEDAGAMAVLTNALEGMGFTCHAVDSATGGPDLVRGIYPTAVSIDADGAVDIPEERIAELAREVIESRTRGTASGPRTKRGKK